MRYSPYLAHFYARIKAARGTGKAIIALAARKFLGIIYRTPKNDWIFEDFPRIRDCPSPERKVGALSPHPQGLSLWGPTEGLNKKAELEALPLRMAACEALGSLPSVALSSAQAIKAYKNHST